MAGGFVLLVLAGLASAAAALASADADAWSVHSAEVRQAEARLFQLVQRAETGQRGYLLNGDTIYLDPFTAARTAAARLSKGTTRVFRNIIRKR